MMAKVPPNLKNRPQRIIPGMTKCKKECHLCPYVKETKLIQENEFKWKINKPVNCETDNVIYEIYNEPLNVSWSEVIKPYAIQVIQAIRAIDPDNLIIVGSPEWSQRVDLVAEDPITTFSNIAYTLHFYTVYHQDWLRDRATAAINNGIPIFVTEWGSIGYSIIDSEANKWMNWCHTNKISHLNWAVNDKEEEWSIVIAGARTTGQWQESDLTEAGKLAKNIISNWPD